MGDDRGLPTTLPGVMPVPTVVCDLGGVLFDFQGDQLIAGHSRRSLGPEQLERVWAPLVLRFETGACTPRRFAVEVVAAFDLDLDPARFLEAFRLSALGFYPGALALVRRLAGRCRVVSLSNINAVQWPEVLRHLQGDDPFHRHFPSHLTGRHKPAAAAYLGLAAELGGGPFLLIDDRAENVAGARAAGWQAHQVEGVAAAADALRRAGVLAD